MLRNEKIFEKKSSPNWLLLGESQITIGSGLVDGNGAALEESYIIFKKGKLEVLVTDVQKFLYLKMGFG